MSSRTWIGLGAGTAVGLALAIGCSSSNSDPLAGQEQESDGGGGSGYCPTATTVSAGQGYATNPAGDNSAPGCPSCHTSDMGGSLTPLAAYVTAVPASYLYPPNLTPDMATGVGSWRDSDLSLAITEGIDNQSERLCPQMQHYPGMCATEVTGVIAWLRSLPAVSRQVPRSICPPLKPNPDGGL